MGKKDTYMPCRCSAQLIQMLNLALVDGTTKQNLVQNLVSQFILAPKFLDPLYTKELRAPVTKMITFSFDEETAATIQTMASEHNMSVSALLRMIIFYELTNA